MIFCPACGRQRSGNSGFCSGCGRAFSEPAADGGTALWSAPASISESAAAADPAPAPAPQPTAWDESPDVTRWDSPVDVTRGVPSAARTALPQPDPFAAWFAPERPAAPADQLADTLYSLPSLAAEYPPPCQPGPAFPPPPRVPPDSAPSQAPSRGRRTAFIIAAILVVLAAGGGAYALVSGTKGNGAAQPSGNPASSAQSTAQASATAAAPGSPTASTSPQASATASASPSSGLVAVAPGVGPNPATPQVETVLTHYFQGINTHSYAEYSTALDAQEQANQPQSSFDSGYSTTTDSGMTLTSLASTANGGLAATVTFTSHQWPSKSVDNHACNTWTLTIYLVPRGTGYLQGPSPAAYEPTHSDC